MLVVIVLELLEGLLQFLDCPKGSDPEQIFLERPDEALGTAVPFGGADRDGEDVAPNQAISFWKSWLMYFEPLSWRMVRPAATVRADRPKHSSRTPADRLKRLEARAPRGGMDANAACRAMIDHDKDGHTLR